MKIEYGVRPVTRYMVTRFHEDGARSRGSEPYGVFDNANLAYQVAFALAHQEALERGASAVFPEPEYEAQGIVVRVGAE